MCLAQGPQRSDAGEARTRGPSVSSQALYHWATALPYLLLSKSIAGARLLLQIYVNSFETLQMFCSWSEDVHVVWI